MLEFRVLGTVGAQRDGQAVTINSRQARAVLAYLLTKPNRACSRDALIDLVWGEDVPDHAPELLRSLVSRLRRALDPEGSDEESVIASEGGGYVLRVTAESFDALSFARLADEGRRRLANGEAKRAVESLDAALDLWDGSALGEFAEEEFARIEAARLEELRLGAIEARAEARLEAGHLTEAVADLTSLVEQHPFRERLWELYLKGLYRSGRQGDALREYERLRTLLVEQLGVDPSPSLQALERAILEQDVALDPPRLTRRGDPGGVQVDERLPFVGRAEQLDEIARALTRSDIEGRQVVLVAGEPGVGKSRLVREAARRATSENALVLLGACDPDGFTPYRPFVQALQQMVHHASSSDLPRLLGRRSGELVRLLPSLADLLPAAQAPVRSDPETERYQLFDAVSEWLAASSRTQPLAVVIDDLHWAGRPTLALLRHLLFSPTASHILIVATYRETDLVANPGVADLLANLHRLPDVHRIALQGLSLEDVEHLVSGEIETWDRETVIRIHEDANGNPFLLGELIRDLAETGALRPPRSVHAMVEARLRDLSDPARDLLRVGAVCGSRFLLPAAADASGADIDDALDAVEECCRAGLLDEDAGVPDQYRFVHELVRSTLLAGLSGSRRTRLHFRVAAAMERQRGPEVAAATLAFHFAAAGHAGDPERAVAYCLDAAREARANFANEETIQWCEEALALSDADDPRRSDLLVLQGEALRALGDERFSEVLREAIDLARDRGDADNLARALLARRREFWSGMAGYDADQIELFEEALDLLPEDRTLMRVRLLATLAGELGYSRDHQRQQELSDEAIRLARELGDSEALVDALVNRRLSVWDADLGLRLRHADEMVSLAHQVENPALRWQAYSAAIVPHLEAGAVATAEQLVADVRAMGEESGDPRPLWSAAYHGALIAQLKGDLDGAEALAALAAEVGHPGGEVENLVAYAGQQFFLKLERGLLEECEEVFEMATEYGMLEGPVLAAGSMLFADLGREQEATWLLDELVGSDLGAASRDPIWVVTLCLAARAAWLLEHRRAAEVLLPHLAEHSRGVAVVSGFTLGAVDRYLGLLEAVLGRTENARHHLRRALSLHTRLDAQGFVSRTLLDLATLDWSAGEVDDGTKLRESVEKARALAVNGGLELLVQRADALLSRLQAGANVPGESLT